MRFCLFLPFLIWTSLLGATEWPQLPSQPPAGLNQTGKKIWETLVNGNPQWSDWEQLLWDDLASLPNNRDYRKHEAYQKQLKLVLAAADRFFGPVGAQMQTEVRTRAYQDLLRSPLGVLVKPILSAPGLDVLSSFDRAIAKAKSESSLTHQEAELAAWAEINPRNPSQPSEAETRQFAPLVLKKMEFGTRLNKPTFSQTDFENWRVSTFHAEMEKLDRIGRDMYRHVFADAEVFERLRFFQVSPYAENQIPTLRPIQEIYQFGEPIPVQWASERTIVQDELIRKMFHYVDTHREGIAHNVICYVDVAPYGLIGLVVSDEYGASLDSWAAITAAPNFYNQDQVRKYQGITVFARLLENRRQYLTSIFNQWRWQGTSSATRSELFAASRRAENLEDWNQNNTHHMDHDWA